jgi:PAS domain S-box-containing protein
MAERRILIVADNPAAGRRLETRVTGIGFDVTVVASVSGDGIRDAADAAPDLGLVAMPLPGATSLAATADAIRRGRPVPVVFMGPAAHEASVTDAGLADPYAYVATPVGDRELRTNLELALCRSEAGKAVHELEGFFAVSLDMFCFLDFSGYFKRLNPAWERVLGFSRAELMARPFIEFVHPDDRERTLQQNKRVRSGDQAIGFENRYLCKDGSYRWLLWSSTKDSEGRVVYAAARDITARKLAEEEGARLLAELEATLAEVQALQEILPICSYCRKIRDDEDFWHTVESYFQRHTNTRFSHGICPSCMDEHVGPALDDA